VTIPLLSYQPTCQNQRISGFEVQGDDQPKIFTTDNLLSASDMDALIEAAYRQIFFHAFAADREPILESQLRNGQITVRDFIRGLLLSDTYTRSFYNLNSNYRFVEQCVQRALGRDAYSKRETIAWSIVIATKGVAAFVDDLLNSEEYLSSFGDNTVPYQRRRCLPSRSQGEIPFNIRSPRYNEYYRSKFGFPQLVGSVAPRSFAAPTPAAQNGDPSKFMEMARAIRPMGAQASRVATGSLDYMSKVPYRQG
jgi:phycobilisome rod-core linker protein